MTTAHAEGCSDHIAVSKFLQIAAAGKLFSLFLKKLIIITNSKSAILRDLSVTFQKLYLHRFYWLGQKNWCDREGEAVQKCLGVKEFSFLEVSYVAEMVCCIYTPPLGKESECLAFAKRY